MSNHDWKESVGQLINLRLAQMQNRTETGDSVTLKISGFVKLTKDDSETRLLSLYQETLKAAYPLIFPQFRDLGNIAGYRATELEHLGDHTLEEALLGKAGPKPESYFYRQIFWIKDTIRLLSTLKLPDEQQKEACQAFLNNLLYALITNTQAAPQSIDEQALVTAAHSAEMEACLCHNDFSVTNIICQPDCNARLIDPRWSTPGGRPYETAPFGSIAIDCASIFVSLERKDLERDALGLPGLKLSKELYPLIEGLVTNQVFNWRTFNLCLAQAYAVYCACRCDYCLSPERSWLYEKMRQGLDDALHRL